MTEIRFSPEAIKDLNQIRDWFEEEYGYSADPLLSKIMKKIQLLSDFPRMGASLSSIIRIETCMRYLVCGKYRIFYFLSDGYVDILSVLYEKQDYMQILFNDTSVES